MQYASLELRSNVYPGGTGDDSHIATFSVCPIPRTRPFRFKLSGEVRLSSVAVNGRVVRVQHRGDEVTVPSLPPDQWNRIDVLYKSASSPHWFRERRRIVVPRAEAEILHFRWQLAVPPGTTPSGTTAGLRWHRVSSGPFVVRENSGTAGSTSRGGRCPFIQGGPWSGDFGMGPDLAPDHPETSSDGTPPNWSVWHASAENAPEYLGLVLWHDGQARALAWVVCLSVLLAGLLLQASEVHSRKTMGIAFLASAAAGSLVAPERFPLFLGACVSGAVLAFLFSRPWLSRAVSSQPVQRTPIRRALHPASTVTFEHFPLVLGLAAWLASIASAVAQEGPMPSPAVAAPAPASMTPTAPPNPPNSNPTVSAPPLAAGEILVVIPVPLQKATNKQPAKVSDEERLVYVPRETLDALYRAPAKARAGSEGNYVFISSQYVVSVEDRRLPSIEATFHVALTSPGTPKSIRLPLSHVALAGANACRLNGRPHPLRRTEDGYVLTIDPAAAEPSRAGVEPVVTVANSAKLAASGTRLPVIAPRLRGSATTATATATEPAPESGPRECTISLKLFPDSNASISPTGFEIGVPKVADTTIRRARDTLKEPIVVTADNGRAFTLQTGDDTPVELEDTSRLQIALGAPPAPHVPAPKRGPCSSSA